MKHKIIAVGKLREKYIKEGVADFRKRLSQFGDVEIVEVAAEKTMGDLSPAQEQEIKFREGERLLKTIKADDYLIALDVKGKNLSSEKLAQHIENLALRGNSRINWIIGGHLGLSKDVLGRADLTLSLSPLTLPHQLVRLILLEQLYRAAKISAGQPYHR